MRRPQILGLSTLAALLFVLAGCGRAGATFGDSSGVVTLDGQTIYFMDVRQVSDDGWFGITMENSATSRPMTLRVSIEGPVEEYTCYRECDPELTVEFFDEGDDTWYVNETCYEPIELCINKLATKDGGFTTGTLGGTLYDGFSGEGRGVSIQATFSAKRK